MKKILLSVIVVLLIAGIVTTVVLREDMADMQAVQLTPDLHMLTNPYGGNVAVLKTGAGAVIVDTMTLGLQGRAIQAKAEELTGEPVVAIINSHYHLDHSHGNPAFPPGTRVIATQRSLHHLKQLDADTFSGEAAQLLPNETFADEHSLTIGNKTLRLLRPGRGHTDGDLVVLFVEDKALHSGDLFFNKQYPNIDLEAGGSVVEWGDTLDAVLALPFEQVIPGHGALTDANGLRQFQTFIRQLAEVGAYAASINGSLTDTLVNGRLTEDAGYSPTGFGAITFLDRDFVIQRAWEEATGNFELYPGY
jgi:cyclase